MENIIAFPNRSERFIDEMIGRSPALGIIAGRVLPPSDDPRRLRVEQLFSGLLERLLHLPEITLDQAEVILAHDTPRTDVMLEEIGRLADDPRLHAVHDLWREVWELAETEDLRDRIVYAAALLARLYRLERQAQLEVAAP